MPGIIFRFAIPGANASNSFLVFDAGIISSNSAIISSVETFTSGAHFQDSYLSRSNQPTGKIENREAAIFRMLS